VSQDRLKQAFRDLQRLDPMLPYRRIYRAKVMAQSGDLDRVDVRPFDPSLPDMAGIELRHGVPGIKVQVQPGCTIQIGWDDGKPHQPFAALWSTDASAVKISIPATLLELGMIDAPFSLVQGETWQLTFNTLMTLLTAAMTSVQPVAVDGGIAITALLTGIQAAQQAQYLSPTVKTS
jgi:hypothetical protein